MSIGPAELLIFGVPLLAFVVLASVDAARTPRSAFARAGASKEFWVLVPIVGLALFFVVGLVGALVWFGSMRRKVLSPVRGPALCPNGRSGAR